jgi:fermentation-respiration switch protein FrsA (DUF1100 family)
MVWLVTVAACYLGVLIVLLALENAFIYHPTRDTEDWQAPPNDRVQDVELHTADGTRIHAWWCPPQTWEPAQGAVLYCHGNAGNLSYRGEGITRWQQQMNLAVLIFDYPGYGRSAGRPSEAGCYAAAEAAYDWLTQIQHVPAERIVLYGGSLGGSVAVELASRHPCRALVVVSTFTSIPDMAQKQFPWMPARWLVRNRFDNLAKIGHCRQPFFQAHGTADSTIPFSMGQRLFAAANEPKQFFAMDGYDHNHAPGPDFYAALRDFLAEQEKVGVHYPQKSPEP